MQVDGIVEGPENEVSPPEVPEAPCRLELAGKIIQLED
jgi:hypothetical protein